MSFEASFAQCMRNAGVGIDPAAVTERSHFTAALAYLKSWFDGLDQRTREALDAATTNDAAAYLLAEANVAPGIPDLLNHFDAAVGWPLSTLLEWCLYCVDEAAVGVGQTG